MKLRTIRRFGNRLAGLAALLLLAVHIFPALIFGQAFAAEGVTLRARTPLPPQAQQRIEEAMRLVRRSELYVPGRSEQVALCNNHALFIALAPGHGDSFAYSLPITDHIFVATADVAQDTCRRAGEQFNRRRLSAVIAHEITHGLIRHRLGLLKAMTLPSWIAEGYPDYVAHESSFPEERGIELLRDGKEDPSPSFHYFLWRQMVEHVIDDEHSSFADLVARAADYDRVKRETIAALPTP